MLAGRLRYGEGILNVDVSREIAVPVLYSPLNVAFGAAVRRETFEIDAGEPASWIQGFHPDQYGDIAPSGSQVFAGFRPTDEVDESRDNFGLYLDLEGDILPRVLANVAARFENYSDFGSKLTGKVALRVQPTSRVTLRSAASTGFRAPSLNQTYYSSTGTTFEDDGTGTPIPIDFGIFPVASAEARALGARDLHEETSTNLSAGFAFSPSDAITITADYFWIALNDRIALTTLLSGPEVEALLAGVGSDATSAQYFANIVDTRTNGVDVTASWALPVGPGTLDLSGVYNYTRNRVHGDIFTPPELAGSGLSLLDPYGEGGILALEKERPRWRSTLTSGYRSGAWRALVRAAIYGPYTSALYGYTAESVQEYGSQTIWDVEGGWAFGEMLTLSVGARNVFDTFPPRMTDDNSFGLFLYPSASPYGFNGRFLYTRLEATLWR
jgi:iron complex outermembrane receptor protein